MPARSTSCDICKDLETARRSQLDAQTERMIHLEIAASVLATLVFDPVLLQQILDNLLCNGLAHAPPNEPDAGAGRLRISVKDIR
jgi:signal transduction histidine kinase